MFSLRVGLGWGVRLRFACGTESGFHLFYGLRKLFRMMDDIKEIEPNVDGRSQHLATSGGERRAARTAAHWDVFRQMNSVHAAARQRFMLVLHQPEAVVAIHNHVCGDHHPLSFIRCRGTLAIPELRPRYEDYRIVEAILIQCNALQTVL